MVWCLENRKTKETLQSPAQESFLKFIFNITMIGKFRAKQAFRHLISMQHITRFYFHYTGITKVSCTEYILYYADARLESSCVPSSLVSVALSKTKYYSHFLRPGVFLQSMRKVEYQKKDDVCMI